MALFQTIIHPTDFDEPSKEAFWMAQSLAQMVGAQMIVFHVVSPPAVLTPDGRVILDSKDKSPVDLWAEYRNLESNAPEVPMKYAVVVGQKSDAKALLEAKIRELGEGVMVVMGSHGRSGMSRLLWGSKAEEMVRDLTCPVLVVKAAKRGAASVAAPVEVMASAQVASATT